MCDYSLHDVASRPAKVGDKLVSSQFPNAITRGFADPADPRVAVCLMPGTELAFDKEVECDASFRFLPTRKSTHMLRGSGKSISTGRRLITTLWNSRMVRSSW